MRRYIRALAAGSCLAAVTGLATACGGGSGSSSGASAATATVDWWTSGFTPAQIQTLDSRFEKSHPGIKASGQYIAKSDEELPKLISALKSNTQPTVITDQNPSDLPLLAESGKLIPLNGKMDSLTNALYPGIRDSLFYRGKQLGMALSGVGDLALFYNKKDFTAAGISTPPKTWAELVSDARKLTDPAKHRWGFYVPLGDAEWISYAWEPLLWADGGELLNKAQTQAEFDSPAGVRALSTWVTMIRDGSAPATSYAQGGNYDGSPAFASNTVAMLIDGQFDLQTFKQANVDFGVAQLPAGTVSTATNDGIGVAALMKTTSAKDKAGLEFIKWLASPAQGAYLASLSMGLPSSPAQLQQPALKSAETTVPFYNVFAAALTHGKVRPITPAYNAVSQALWTQINLAVTGKESPAAALRTASQQADAALKGQAGS